MSECLREARHGRQEDHGVLAWDTAGDKAGRIDDLSVGCANCPTPRLVSLEYHPALQSVGNSEQATGILSTDLNRSASSCDR